jgi:hypothetical protein
MNYWKWSNGEKYYQSARKNPEKNVQSINLNYDTKVNAIEQSLAEDMPSNFDDFGYNGYNGYNDNDNSGFSSFESRTETRRETLDNKMSDRELISQRGTNPYSMQTSYVNDVVTRDMFLKPINTTQGRTKNQNQEQNQGQNQSQEQYDSQ